MFASDLLRAKRTAEIVVTEKKLVVMTTKLLRERSFGQYEGYNWEKYYEKFNQSLKKYKKFISEGFIKSLFPGSHCRFTPTCSEYTYQAVYKYGTIKGLFLGIKRILRCNPWNKGGIDQVK